MSNYGMQSAAKSGIQTANASASSPHQPALNVMIEALHEMHKVVSELHGIADRACGISCEEGVMPQAPIPVGMIGEVAASMDSLRSRLYVLNSRFSNIA